MNSTPQRHQRYRIPIPPGFPPSLIVGLDKLEGSEVVDAEDQGPIGVVESVSIEDHGPAGPAFLQLGIKARRGYNIRAEERHFGMRLAYLDPTGNPDDPQKWRVVQIERAPK